MQDTGNYYVINHLVLSTGLTDRTIRSYIANGILQGEKINGLWHFTPEQVEAFIRHPAVRPSILAKNNGIVYDFLLDESKTEERVCVILDVPGGKRAEIADFFCSRICQREYHNFRFSFDGVFKTPRVILTGDPAEVLELVKEYRSSVAEKQTKSF